MSPTERTLKHVIGILALQGDYDAHRKTFEQLGQVTAFVRKPADLAGVDALVLPGGESTTVAKLLARTGLDAAILERAGQGIPLFGTCAGMILLAREIEDRPDQPTLHLLDIAVARNAFGRQIDSFEADVEFGETAPITVRGVFIRAPYVTSQGDGVETLSRFHDRVVGVRQGNILAIAYHPELTDDTRVHRYFVEMVEKSQTGREQGQ
jgi:5'-phosphate synthase pdxT subunit